MTRRATRGPSRPKPPPSNTDDATPRGASTGRLGRINDRVLDVLSLVYEGTPADRALEQVFRRARDLGRDERADVTDAVFGVARSRRRIEERLLRSAKALGRDFSIIDEPMKMRLRVLAWLAERGETAEALRAHDPQAAKRIPGLPERLVGPDAANPHRPGTPAWLGFEFSIPDWFVAKLLERNTPERAHAIAAASTGRAPTTIRANTAQRSREALIALIKDGHGVEARPTQHATAGLILPPGTNVRGWSLFEDGAFELQDEGSQLIAEAVGAAPGLTVVDACAGAGGKSLAIAAAMQNKGRIIAIDVDAHKLAALTARARRAGLTNVETHEGDFLSIGSTFTQRADRVLLDVPCSGSGVFRRSPDAPWRFDPKSLDAMRSLGVNLLQRAADVARPGARIVYATCSVLAIENEDVVGDALGREPRLGRSVVALPMAAGAHELNVGPGGEDGPDGYYIASLERR